MKLCMASVSLGGTLAEKIDAVAAAGFDGIELLDDDLRRSGLTARDVAARCSDVGLTIDLYQPFRRAEGISPVEFAQVLVRFRDELQVMRHAGVNTILVVSNTDEDADSSRDLSATQLAELADAAAEFGMSVTFEALAWGTHINRVADAWDVVERASHPALSLTIDTFHMIARGEDSRVLGGIPAHSVGFVQVADAPMLSMDIKQWSRGYRCFPGDGEMDLHSPVAALIDAGYRGPLSLELFNPDYRRRFAGDVAAEAARALRRLVSEVSAAGMSGADVTGTGPSTRHDLSSSPAAARISGPAATESAAHRKVDAMEPLVLEGVVPYPDDVAARYRREGYWVDQTHAEMLFESVAAHPDNIAIVSGDTTITYAELGDEVLRLAAGLAHRGIERGDRVVFHLPNVPEFVPLLFALFEIGAIPVMAVAGHRKHEIDYLVRFTEARAYVTAQRHDGFDLAGLAAQLRDSCPTLDHTVIVASDAGADIEELRSHGTLEHDRRSLPSDVAFFQLSGGTTGLPKIVPHTHEAYLSSVRAAARVGAVTEKSVQLAALPMSYTFVMRSGLCQGMWTVPR